MRFTAGQIEHVFDQIRDVGAEVDKIRLCDFVLSKSALRDTSQLSPQIGENEQKRHNPSF